MSAVHQSVELFNRALADLDTVLRASEHWQDDQRRRLDRSQLTPLRAEAIRYVARLERLDAALEAAQRLLDQ